MLRDSSRTTVPKLHPVQYGVQLVFRLADGWAVFNSFGKLATDYTFGTFISPGNKLDMVLKYSGTALIDTGSHTVLKPLLTEEKPCAALKKQELTTHIYSNVLSGVSLFILGELLTPVKGLMDATLLNIIYQNSYSSSAIMGSLGAGVKGAYVCAALHKKEDFKLLKADETESKSLSYVQSAGHYTARFLGDVAWVEAARNALLFSGQHRIAEDPHFMSLLVGADMVREMFKYVGYSAHPFNQLVPPERRLGQFEIAPEEDARANFVGEEKPPTKWEIGKALGAKALGCIVTGAIVYGLDEAFIQSSVGQGYAKKENESNFATLFRMMHQLVLFAAYVGLPATVDCVKHRYSLWKQKKSAFPPAEPSEVLMAEFERVPSP